MLESESLGILVTYLLPLCIHDVYIDGGMTSNGLGLDIADTMVTEQYEYDHSLLVYTRLLNTAKPVCI